MTAFFHQMSPVTLRFMCAFLPAIPRFAAPAPGPQSTYLFNGGGVPRYWESDVGGRSNEGGRAPGGGDVRRVPDREDPRARRDGNRLSRIRAPARAIGGSQGDQTGDRRRPALPRSLPLGVAD